METRFLLPTETYAEKAKRLLESHRLPFHVKRMTTSEGCTFAFRVNAPPETVFPLLQQYGLPFQRR